MNLVEIGGEHMERGGLRMAGLLGTTVGCRTLSRFVEEDWKPSCVISGGLKESQVESDLSILKNHILPELGHMKLNEISVRDVDPFLSTCRPIGQSVLIFCSVSGGGHELSSFEGGGILRSC